jgi:flagellar hook-associated protein 1 FlgK
MGAGFTADGVTFQLSSGAPVVGDSFLVQPTRNGARDFEMLITDTAKLAVAAPMRTEDMASRPTDPIQLVFDTPPTTFHVVNTKSQGILAVNVPYTTGGNIDYNGWRVQVSGAPAAGDSFIVNSQTAVPSAGNTGGATVSSPVTSTVNNNLGNTGTGRISAGSVNSPYDKVTLTYNAAGATFDVINTTTGAPLATGLAYTAGGNIDFNGWRMQISGAPADGDTFVIDRSVASLGARNTGSGTISETAPVPPNTQFEPDLSKVQRPVTFLFTSASTFKVYEQTAAGMTELTPAALGLDPTSPLTTYGANGFNYDSVNGTAFAANGWSVKLTGNIATGDRFLVGPNTAGSSDNRNALAMGNLQVTNILSDGTASYQSSYSQMVSMVGNQGNQAKIASEAQNTLAKEARSSKSSFSGVNLDEEAANLIKYQQAYQAASKVIAIAQQTFQSILDIG